MLKIVLVGVKLHVQLFSLGRFQIGKSNQREHPRLRQDNALFNLDGIVIAASANSLIEHFQTLCVKITTVFYSLHKFLAMISNLRYQVLHQILLAVMVNSDNFLVLHPFYTGSHVLTLHTVTEQLILRGHKVTTVRYADFNGLELAPMGANHTEIILYLNNSDGSIPWTTRGEQGVFHLPMRYMWEVGLSPFGPFIEGMHPWQLIAGYCHSLLGDMSLRHKLKLEQFDVALVDLVYNECGMALVESLSVPSVGFWATSFTTGEPEFTTASIPACHIPTILSGMSQNMNFYERLLNFGFKALTRGIMWLHTLYSDSIIRQHLPKSPASSQMLADLSGALINTDSFLDYPLLQPESFINVGGLQIRQKSKPLPKVNFAA